MVKSKSHISDSSKETLDVIKKAISEFDDSIELMKEKNNPADWDYTYYHKVLDLHFDSIP